MPALRIVTDATAEPVSLDEVKTYLRLQATYEEEDELLERWIKDARKEAENKTKRCCMPQTWKLFLDDFASTMILPRAPLSTVSSHVVITYLDETSGNSTTLPSTYYTVDYDSEPGRVRLAYDSDWPGVYPVKNAVQIQFVAGYPLSSATDADADTTPEGIEDWILLRVAQKYEHRLPTVEGHIVGEINRSFVDGLLDEYVLIEVNP
jgi:uncharacterized phiE125 gp8 family phage protein